MSLPHLGFETADVMGYSLGGGVALRTAIDHPEVVRRLVLVSTVFEHYGWYPEMSAAMDQMGPEIAEPMQHSPMYEVYTKVAPRVEDWPVLVGQATDRIKRDYDWSAEVPGLPMPVMIVIGDADGLPRAHAVEFFGLLGGGQRDAGWDRSGMTHHRLAILPGLTHHDNQRRAGARSGRHSVPRRRVAHHKGTDRCQPSQSRSTSRPCPKIGEP